MNKHQTPAGHAHHHHPYGPPYRVLHVLSGMNRGGIETWIMNVMRRLDPAIVRFEFLVETRERADYDQEIESLGGVIHHGPRFRRRALASLFLARLLARKGHRYHAVHAHGRHDMAWPLSVARLAGVPVRIAHLHNLKDSHQADPVRRTYRRALKAVLAAQATWILGSSVAAIESLFGPGAVSAFQSMEMLPYGIDLRVFTPHPDETRPDTRAETVRADMRRSLHLPEDALVAGHVGRMVWEKNHDFLLHTFAELAHRDPRWHLVLVGDGPLRAQVERGVDQRGLRQRVRFTGVRSDVPDLLSAFDVFLFPSHIEGLGLVIIEAQAKGVPCVIGSHLPGELDVYPPCIERVTLNASPATWAKRAECLASECLGIDQGPECADRRREFEHDAHAAVEASPFNIERCVAILLCRYYNLPHDEDA